MARTRGRRGASSSSLDRSPPPRLGPVDRSVAVAWLSQRWRGTVPVSVDAGPACPPHHGTWPGRMSPQSTGSFHVRGWSVRPGHRRVRDGMPGSRSPTSCGSTTEGSTRRGTGPQTASGRAEFGCDALTDPGPRTWYEPGPHRCSRAGPVRTIEAFPASRRQSPDHGVWTLQGTLPYRRGIELALTRIPAVSEKPSPRRLP